MAKRQAPPKPEELIKILETKFTEFREETLSRLADNEKVSENTNKSIKENKETISNDFLELKGALDQIKCDIDNKISNETKRSDEGFLILKHELSSLIDDKIGSLKWEVTAKLSSISEVVEFQESSSSRILNQLEDQITWKMKDVQQKLQEDLKKVSRKVQLESNCQNDTKEQIGCLAAMVEEINEKLYDFEASKRNNLIFYGIAGDTAETPLALQEKVSAILKKQLMLKREMAMTAVARIMTGPEVAGCRPVLVTFEEFKDREDVLRKAALLRGSHVQVTEDMSRRVRESRAHLRKYIKDLKIKSPEVLFSLHYDRLYVDHKCYVWSDVQRRVVQYYPGVETEFRARSSRSLSPAKLVISPVPRCSSVDKEKVAETRDEKIRQLENQIKVLSKKLESCDREKIKVNGAHNDEDEALAMCIFTSMRAHQVDQYEIRE